MLYLPLANLVLGSRCSILSLFVLLLNSNISENVIAYILQQILACNVQAKEAED